MREQAICRLRHLIFGAFNQHLKRNDGIPSRRDWGDGVGDFVPRNSRSYLRTIDSKRVGHIVAPCRKGIRKGEAVNSAKRDVGDGNGVGQCITNIRSQFINGL